MKQIKLSKEIRVGQKSIPAGTVLSFSNEGLCIYKGTKLADWQIMACEAQGSMLAEQILHELVAKFPNGFTEAELKSAYPDSIADCMYALMHIDDEAVLMLKTPEDEAIELYLLDADGLYSFTGEYHVASDAAQSMSIEQLSASEAYLQTKSSLAINGVVSLLAGILDDIQEQDKPRLMRVLRVASQAVSASKPSQAFLSNIHKGIV